MKVEAVYENGKAEIIEAEDKKFDDFIIKNKPNMIEKGIKTYNFIYSTEGLNELLGIERTCDTCRNFYTQPIMGGGKCEIQNNKGVCYEDSCESYKIRISYAISQLAYKISKRYSLPESIVEIKINNYLLDGLSWEEIIAKYKEANNE